jgi:hypothetical protein
VKDRGVEQNVLTQIVIWGSYFVMGAFLLSGMWYMYLKPLVKKLGGG